MQDFSQGGDSQGGGGIQSYNEVVYIVIEGPELTSVDCDNILYILKEKNHHILQLLYLITIT